MKIGNLKYSRDDKSVEQIVKIRGPTRAVEIAGRTRYPGAMTATTLREIRIILGLSKTLQIRYYPTFAQETHRTFVLVVRRDTVLSRTHQERVDNGDIVPQRKLP